MQRILVIEDEEALLEEVSDTLRFEGYDVIGARNGLIGLQQAREHLPDLIICDIMMPEMDGYEVLRDLRSDSGTLMIPFIFLTARVDKSDRRKGMNLGADDYLTKPFTHNELLTSIHTRLSRQATTEMQRLRAFSHRLVTLQESERKHTADKLQGEIIPLLVGLQLVLEMNKRLPPDMYPSALQEALTLVETIKTMTDNTAQDLWPASLDHLGLLPALFWQFERYTTKTGLTIDFRHAGLQRPFTTAIKIGLYRVIQEALDNIAEHAGVTAATVRIWVEDKILHAQIIDEGTGFKLDEALPREDSLGLIAMHERLLSLSGELSIVTAPEQGTQVLIKIPVDSVSEESGVHLHETIMRVAEAPSALPTTPVQNEQVFRQRPKPSHEIITILLAGANDIIRRGLKSALGNEPDLVVIAEVDHGANISDVVAHLSPDLVVLDLTLPGGAGGLDITRQITQNCPDTCVLVLSSFREEAYALETFRAGASGYILKSANADELVQAVRVVSSGRRYLSPALSEQALETYLNVQHLQKDTTLDTYGTLTNREREIFHLVLDGDTNAEIAEKLIISPRTVETHRANMMRKLGLRNHREMLRYALRRGIISIDE